MKTRICNWSQDGDEESDLWSSGCGHELTFEEGSPVENGFRFCPFCGADISSTPLVWDGEATVLGATVFPLVTDRGSTSPPADAVPAGTAPAVGASRK